MQGITTKGKIEYLPYDAIDLQKWDRCIKGSLNSMVYGYSWYLDIVCETWDALVEGDYEAVFPLPFNRKAGISYLYQPPFTQQLGLFSGKEITAQQVDRFLNAIPKRFKLIELMLNRQSRPENSSTTFRNNWELSLTPQYPKIEAAYTDNLKRNLKRANKSKLTIANHADPGRIIDIFRDNRGKDVVTLQDNHYKRLIRLYHTLFHKGFGRSYGAFNEQNELIAGALLIFDHQRVIFIFSGTNEEAKTKGAMSLLIDHIIKKYAGTEMVFDFEGSMHPGLARFYAGFGADKFEYWFYRKSRIPGPFLRLIKKFKS